MQKCLSKVVGLKTRFKVRFKDRLKLVYSSAITVTYIRGYTTGKTSSQSVVVRLGGLDWIVTYLSKDMSSNVIATLWLLNNVQDVFKNRSQT